MEKSQSDEWYGRMNDPTAALDGDQWKVYPKLAVPGDPDTGLLIQDRSGCALEFPGYRQ